MTTPITYRLRLDKLTVEHAKFTGGKNSRGIRLTLPRDEWVRLGLPGYISVTPEAVWG